MTRINIISPKVLSDQHLIAEIKEINQLAGSFRKSLQSKNGIKDIPVTYRLNAGHVKFFYPKGKFLHNRFNDLKQEAISRGFNIVVEFQNEWLKNNRKDLYNDWVPNNLAYNIIHERISQKLRMKPTFYKYNKKNIENIENFIKEMKK